MPAEQVTLLRKLEGPRRLELDPHPLLHFIAEPVNSTLGQNVLQARMLSVGAITEVAMDSHNRFGDRFQRLRREETDNVCQTWVGLRVAMGHSHAAAGQQIVADQFLPFRDNDEAKIIGENIDIIQRGNGKSRLKLAWQINFSIKRIDKAL